MELKEMDPRGLFGDSYRIEGITEGECRSIFLDWAIGVPVAEDAKRWLGRLYAHYQPLFPDHPMTKVLAEGLEQAATARRRGGRDGRAMRQAAARPGE